MVRRSLAVTLSVSVSKFVVVVVMDGVDEWVVQGPDCSAMLTPVIIKVRGKAGGTLQVWPLQTYRVPLFIYSPPKKTTCVQCPGCSSTASMVSFSSNCLSSKSMSSGMFCGGKGNVGGKWSDPKLSQPPPPPL